MGIYAISDLHLDCTGKKPMHVFGDNWMNHADKIKSNWEHTVAEKDTVLLPGDLTWALPRKAAEPDLRWINDLPGHKIVVEGNHDFFWDGTKKLNATYDNITFLKCSHTICEGFGICGTRGWILPDYPNFTSHDKKIYNRELNRLKLSLGSAVKEGMQKIIVMMHFPPSNRSGHSGFIDLIQQYPVWQVIYGHLHSESEFDTSIRGEHKGIVFRLVSADYLDFSPILIMK